MRNKPTLSWKEFWSILAIYIILAVSLISLGQKCGPLIPRMIADNPEKEGTFQVPDRATALIIGREITNAGFTVIWITPTSGLILSTPTNSITNRYE